MKIIILIYFFKLLYITKILVYTLEVYFKIFISLERINILLDICHSSNYQTNQDNSFAWFVLIGDVTFFVLTY
jgi:hypothetical protein